MTITAPTLCTREQVKSALDSRETRRNNRQVDAAIEAAREVVEGALRRSFVPSRATRYFDWPTEVRGRAWRLYLGEDELVSVVTLSSGGTTIAASDFILRGPDTGPPFDRIELDLSSSAAFGGGSTYQQDVTVLGIFGYTSNWTSAGTAAEAMDTSETGYDVSNSAALGVGDLLAADSEWMLVTDKSLLDTTVDISNNLTAQPSSNSITVPDGTLFFPDEVLTIDSERMLIEDIAANALLVRRAYDGSVLAAHAGGTSIFAPRRLTVVRGAQGTTAASHNSGISLTRHVVPPLVNSLAVGVAEDQLLQETSGYVRTVGSGEGERSASGAGLKRKFELAFARHGRIRVEAV